MNEKYEQLASKVNRNKTWAEMSVREQVEELRNVVRHQNECIRNLESSVRLLTIHSHNDKDMVTIPFAHEHLGVCRSGSYRILE